MTRFIYIIAIIFALAFPSAILASALNESSPLPRWVERTALPSGYQVPTDDIQGGAYFLLVDTQVHVPAQGDRQFYREFAVLIENQSGVEDQSQINIEFDPGYETLELHEIKIIRSTERHDRLASAKIELLQRETEMDSLIRTGRKTMSIILDDIRVGDTLLYSYSVSGANPIQQGHFGSMHSLSWAVPVERVNLTINWHKPVPLYHKLFNTEQALQVSTISQGKRYQFSASNVAPVLEEDNTPDWFFPRARVQFSEFENWKGVVEWGLPLYAAAVNSSPEIEKITNKLRLQHTDVKDRIAAALQIVQNDIRYLGLELGENSHRPTLANETLARRFGDCKDKTILFVTFLKALGVEAYPALVNTDTGKILPHYLPTIGAFDHVITLVKIDGQSYWLDPTRSYQYGPLDAIFQPQYGYALVLKAGEESLTEIMQGPETNAIHAVENFTLDAAESTAATYATEATYSGKDAEFQRSNFSSEGVTSLAEQYLQYYEDFYYQVEAIESLSFSDDRDRNKLITKESYRLEKFWEVVKDGRREANFYANVISPELALPDSPRRTQPYYISFPKNLRQTLTIKLPEDGWNFDADRFVEENAYFSFSMDVGFDKAANILTLDFDYQSRAGYVNPDNFADYIERLKAVEDYLSYGIFQNTAAPVVAEPSWLKELSVAEWVGIIFCFYLLLLLAWRIEVKFSKVDADATFYPVAIPKFIAMWILTFGAYSLYWFYKNYAYLKVKNGDASMPVFRAIFNNFWYYPLWKALSEDNKIRYQERHLPVAIVAGIFAALYLLDIFSNKLGFPLLSVFVGCLLVIPLVNYILFVNQDNVVALAYNSKWNYRHYLLGLVSVPLLSLSVGSEVGLMPAEHVVKGDALYGHTLTDLRRRGVIAPKDRIQYFYSDATFFFRDDGNGFTNRHVFSYWMDDETGFELEQADFKDVAKIEIEPAPGWAENAVITVTRDDDTHFIMLISSFERGDRKFYKELTQRWKTERNKLSVSDESVRAE